MLRGTDLLGDTLAVDSAETATNHFIEGLGGNDTLTGGDGDDFIDGGDGDDTIVGGAGTDKVRFVGNKSAYTIGTPSEAGGQFTVTDGTYTDTLTGIEELIFDDRIFKVIASGETAQVSSKTVDTDGDKADDQTLWSGTDDADTITGTTDMNNVIDGGEGADVLTGANLSDTFKPGSGADTIDGGANTDLDASGNQLPDIVQFSGNKADHTIRNIQESAFTLSGVVEAGDTYTVMVGSNTVTYTVTSSDVSAGDSAAQLASVATNLATAISVAAATGSVTVNGASQSGNSLIVDDVSGIQAGVTYLLGDNSRNKITAVDTSSNTLTLENSLSSSPADDAVLSVTDIDYSTTGAQITLTGTGTIFAVSTSVTNGTQAATATDGSAVTSVAVNGTNQSGTSLIIDGEDAGDIEAGDYIAYTVATDNNGDGDTSDDGETVSYGPYEVSSVSGSTLTLAESMGASPADDASITVTENNPDNTQAISAASYSRYVTVEANSETDTLRNIEKLLFDDQAMSLIASQSAKAEMSATGISTTWKVKGTTLADLLTGTDENEIFYGYDGSDHIVLADDSGTDQARGFVAGAGGDVLSILLGADDTDGLNGNGVDTITEVIAQASQQGDDTVIDLGAGNQITLVGVTSSDLVDANFEIVSADTF